MLDPPLGQARCFLFGCWSSFLCLWFLGSSAQLVPVYTGKYSSFVNKLVPIFIQIRWEFLEKLGSRSENTPVAKYIDLLGKVWTGLILLGSVGLRSIPLAWFSVVPVKQQEGNQTEMGVWIVYGQQAKKNWLWANPETPWTEKVPCLTDFDWFEPYFSRPLAGSNCVYFWLRLATYVKPVKHKRLFCLFVLFKLLGGTRDNWEFDTLSHWCKKIACDLVHFCSNEPVCHQGVLDS